MSDKKQKRSSFLKTIKQIESGNGENYNHNLIQKGIHEGHKAIGGYGLMPNTVSEILNRKRLNHTLTPELDRLNELDPVTLKSVLEENPNLEEQIAEGLADHVLDRQGGDEEKAAYSWLNGHNLTPKAIATKPYKNSDYVKKYNTYKKMIKGDSNGE
jgi:hypothetical protein